MIHVCLGLLPARPHSRFNLLRWERIILRRGWPWLMAAIQSLDRLLPNSGEAHLALAKHYYWGYLDYDRAQSELELAQEELA